MTPYSLPYRYELVQRDRSIIAAAVCVCATSRMGACRPATALTTICGAEHEAKHIRRAAGLFLFLSPSLFFFRPMILSIIRNNTVYIKKWGWKKKKHPMCGQYSSHHSKKDEGQPSFFSFLLAGSWPKSDKQRNWPANSMAAIINSPAAQSPSYI